ncbi:transketolase [Streptomyces alkaliphilus]|uniref:Dihydrolipoamide acetyltransferase component of pyruvate dehydrogenase complex n=1 Tax=Streptomyces alkaliphilus TaxID=1472722 RepID=A0A7W3T9J4_9ACTN|nr:2-oxo acid dehydrogenase subunit E2 [Streptomyces alkaliphilus]MBB0242555.1 transketolase [Streptomyces alkaliphilus]
MREKPAPRVVEALNGALHRLFDERPRLHLLGEDIHDPYGGAFKVTRGLSTKHPDRVLTTPLSESGITGVAAGLALAGDQALVEIMFGDFAALAFDHILNLISKSVTMYGEQVPMPVVVRCPVGGTRGYGPTHSQSVQKYFLGIPNLKLYETSPFHDPYVLLSEALDHGPAMLFEDKVLYTRRLFRDDVVDAHHRFTLLAGPAGWAHMSPIDGGPADVVLLCPGGMAHRAIEAVNLLRERGIVTHLLVPARLHPLDLAPVLPLITAAPLVAVAEESTEGGTWGADVAARIHGEARQRIRSPLLLSSRDSVIPTARHLETMVLLDARRITEAVTEAHSGRTGDVPADRPVEGSTATTGVLFAAPKLNTNDTTYLVLHWHAEDGAYVTEDTPLVEVETSKAVEEIAAPASGRLRVHVDAGGEVAVGELLAELLPDELPPASAPEGALPGARPAPRPVPEPTPGPEAGRYPRTRTLDRVQRATAAVVSRAHREVPAAFTAIEVRIDEVMTHLRRMSAATGAEVGLPEVIVKAVAAARPAFPHLFGSLRDERTVELADRADVGVTLDAGNGLYTPVLRDCASRPLAEIADDLMEFRLKALRGEFSASELSGGAITVSLNPDPGVLLVHPIVMWPQLCMISVGGPLERVSLMDGVPVPCTATTLGLAYDHRAVNGREATAFLRTLAGALRDPEQLAD